MSDSRKILIIDDDRALTGRAEAALKKKNYRVRILTEKSDLLPQAETFRPDLLILDPHRTEGIVNEDIAKLWRETHLPILVVSERDDVVDKVLALEMGADDYLVKPYDLRELTARVHALLRRCGSTPASAGRSDDSSEAKDQYLVYPDLKISLGSYSVLYREQPVRMPPKELELLYFLASAPNRVFTREMLLDQIWGFDYVGDTRTVDVHIKRIRKKLPATKDWAVTTVWGVGYKFALTGQE